MPKISLNIDELQAEKQILGDFLARPDAYSDTDYMSKNKRFTELDTILQKATLRQTLEEQMLEAKELSGGNDELAEIAGVAKRSIQQAKSIQTNAAPEVVEAVKRGEVGLPKAAAIAKLPLDEQAAALHKPAPKPAKPTPVVEPETEAPADYTELDALREHVGDLQADLVVARMGDIPEEEKLQAETLIADLRAEVKTLTATLKAAYLSRDSLMEENAQMKRQMQMQRREIDKFKNSK